LIKFFTEVDGCEGEWEVVINRAVKKLTKFQFGERCGEVVNGVCEIITHGKVEERRGEIIYGMVEERIVVKLKVSERVREVINGIIKFCI